MRASAAWSGSAIPARRAIASSGRSSRATMVATSVSIWYRQPELRTSATTAAASRMWPASARAAASTASDETRRAG